MAQVRRLYIVAGLLGFLIIMHAPDLRRGLGHPLGVSGVSFGPDGAVNTVDAAARSDIQVGDRIDLSRAQLEQRYSYFSQGTADAGTRISLPLIRGSRHFVAHTTTFPESQDRITMVWLREAIALLLTVLATLVLLRRPSFATWAFFLLMFQTAAPVNDAYLLGPLWWRVLAYELYTIQLAVFSYGALFFALHLLHPGPLPAWRRFAQCSALVAASASVLVAVIHATMLMFGPQPDPEIAWIFYGLQVLPWLTAPPLLIATYFESSPTVRQRLRWVIAGFWTGALFVTIDKLGSQSFPSVIPMSYVVHSLLICGTSLSIGLTVAYAVLKHRIIDLDVAISRATAYSLLSVGILGAFALVDLFFTRALALSSAGLIADVGLALALGFSFNSLHHRIDRFVDRVLFKKRHLADEYIAGLARAMVYAQSKTQVRAMLIEEPTRAFGLSGCDLLTGIRDGPNSLKILASYLEAQRAPTRLSEGQWDLSLLSAAFVPAIAVPLFSHTKLDAIALFGMHLNGTDLDAGEVALIDRLATVAGLALDRLEAEDLRRENVLLRHELREVHT